MRTHVGLAQRRRSSMAVPRRGSGGASVPLSTLLQRWQDDRIVTPEQAALMAASAGPVVSVGQLQHPVHPQRGSLVVEGLGYLGGAIVVVATMLIASWYWDDLATGWRLTMVGGVTLALLAAGAFLPLSADGAGGRLRAVLWFASAAACAGFLAVLAVDALDLGSRNTMLFIASGTAAYAFLPWFASRAILQQLALMGAIAATAAAAVNKLDVSPDAPGLGAWGVGLVWALLGWGGVVAHTRFALALGSATAIVGAMLTAGTDIGTALTLVTVLAVLGAAVALRDLLLLGVAMVGLLINVPAAMTRWFPDSLAAVYGLLAAGLALVLVAVWVARRRPQETVTDERPGPAARTVPALAASGLVVLGVVVTVVAIALR